MISQTACCYYYLATNRANKSDNKIQENRVLAEFGYFPLALRFALIFVNSKRVIIVMNKCKAEMYALAKYTFCLKAAGRFGASRRWTESDIRGEY